MTTVRHYDIIGDIHGYAEPLKDLLSLLGYTKTNGVYSHPSRIAIFLGDFIDRGPNQKAVLDIVRPMIDQKHALSVMGNHEFNAICYATIGKKDQHIRPHNEKNTKQHQAFLNEFPLGSKHHLETIEWFKKLPVYLDLEGIGIVHACWCTDSFNNVSAFLNADNTLSNESYVAYDQKRQPFYTSIERILKGPEQDIPPSLHFHDADGTVRDASRVNWWVSNESPVSEKLALAGKKLSQQETISINATKTKTETFNLPAKPVFVGHYWMKGTPDALSDNVACVDYSVAKGGKMTAYQWSGENTIKRENFTWV
jgi:hypothetical protein